MKQFILSLVATVVMTASVFGQELIGWDTSNVTGYGTSPFNPTTNVAPDKLTVTGLTKGSGLGSSGTAAARAWGGTFNTSTNSTTAADAIAKNTYVTFTVKPNDGYKLSLSAVNLDYRRSATGAASGLLQYQLNSDVFVDIQSLDFSVTASGGGTIPEINLSSISALQNVTSTTTITFRIVLFGSTTTGTNSAPWYIFDKGNSSSSDFYLQGTVATATLAATDINTAKANLVKNTIVSSEVVFGASAKVSVYNTAGQIVKTAEVTENSRLDVSALPKGTYIVTGLVNGQTVSQKIIKK